MAENKRRYRPLTQKTLFRQLRNDGRTIHVTSWMLVNWQMTELEGVRCGWTIPGHVGTAVTRNRLKRWGREFLRKWSEHHNLSLDLNIVMKRKKAGFYRSLSHEEFDFALSKMVQRIRSSSP
ncbi:MAG: ribonuclease P protein component [Bdellovibrionales bacterium]